MLSRLFSRVNRSFDRAGVACNFEGLEGRLLMTAAPRVLSVVADNRGEVTIQLSRTVTGVSKSSVKLFTVGANGTIGDADDVRQPAQVVYTASNNRITIKGKLQANAGYRVRVDAKLVKSVDGRTLDGEYSGGTTFGDGKPGGNFAFQVKNDRTKTPTIRLSTSEGVINVRVDENTAPLSSQAYINYANGTHFDSSFFTRTQPGFIVQGGSLQVNSSNQVVSGAPTLPSVASEYHAGTTLEPLRGTISLAKGNDPTISFVNDFFFNTSDNSGILDDQNGGFVSFGTVTNASGLTAIDAIAAKQQADLEGQISPSVISTSHTDVTTVPVLNASAATALNPKNDLVIIRRVAVLDKIAPVV